jgi:arylsulfatase A-like enzyme
MIRDTDLSLQQLEDAMDELALWEDTVVIFTADHGEMAGVTAASGPRDRWLMRAIRTCR